MNDLAEHLIGSLADAARILPVCLFVCLFAIIPFPSEHRYNFWKNVVKYYNRTAPVVYTRVRTHRVAARIITQGNAEISPVIQNGAS